MRLLLLGGTAFLGREVARAASARGHEVTCLARGTSPPPDGVRFVGADRDDDTGLAPVAGIRWDAVVDLARHPGHTRRAVRDLTAAHWVYVSSANAYADSATAEQPETAPVRAPLDGDVLEDLELYGEAKVACENAVRDSGAPAAVVRPGLIGGPGDESGRSGYWPWRFAHPTGEDVVVPDDADFPCAMVDVRDLAAWLVIAAEERLDGPFNVTGPTMTLGGMLSSAADVARAAGGPPVRTLPVPVEVLSRLGVRPWMGPMSLPLWVDDPQWRGLATLDTSRARGAGLVLRPLAETLRGALAFEEDGRVGPRSAGLTDDEERRVRDALA